MINTEFLLPELLAWRAIDGVWLVYQQRTGLMLPLDQVSASVVSLLEEGPARLDALVQRLAQETDLPADGTLADAVQAVLSPLCEAGLVARSDQPTPW